MVEETIELAFRKWAEVIPKVFRRTASRQDINIRFAEGNEGKASNNRHLGYNSVKTRRNSEKIRAPDVI